MITTQEQTAVATTRVKRTLIILDQRASKEEARMNYKNVSKVYREHYGNTSYNDLPTEGKKLSDLMDKLYKKAYTRPDLAMFYDIPFKVQKKTMTREQLDKMLDNDDTIHKSLVDIYYGDEVCKGGYGMGVEGNSLLLWFDKWPEKLQQAFVNEFGKRFMEALDKLMWKYTGLDDPAPGKYMYDEM